MVALMRVGGTATVMRMSEHSGSDEELGHEVAENEPVRCLQMCSPSSPGSGEEGVGG